MSNSKDSQPLRADEAASAPENNGNAVFAQIAWQDAQGIWTSPTGAKVA